MKKNHVLFIVIFFVSRFIEAYTLKDHLVYGKAVTAAQANEWDKADALLSDLLVDHHDDPQVLYDEAVVAYKNNDMDRAYNYFKRAAEHVSLDEARQEKACYNCANAAVGKQDLETALSWYDRTLALNPENEYAIFNRDVVRKKLEEQKQEEQKQEQEQDKQEQNQNEQQEQDGQQENQQQDEQKKNGDDKQKEKNKNQQQLSENNQEQSDDSSEEQQKESDERQEQQSEPKQERGDKRGNKNQKQNSRDGGSEQQERQNQEALDDAMKDQIQKQAQEQQKKHDQSPGQKPSDQNKQEAAKKQEQAQKAAKEAAQEAAQKAGQKAACEAGQKAGAGQMAQANAAEQDQGGEPDDAWLAYMLAQQDKEDKAVNKRILGAAVAHEQGSDTYEHCW